MTMPILRLIDNVASDAALISPAFAQVLDDHREYLRNAQGSSWVAIPAQVKGPAYGDFYFILKYLSIDRGYHRVIMLLNGFTHPSQYTGQVDSVFLPNLNVINDLMVQFRTGASKVFT